MNAVSKGWCARLLASTVFLGVCVLLTGTTMADIRPPGGGPRVGPRPGPGPQFGPRPINEVHTLSVEVHAQTAQDGRMRIGIPDSLLRPAGRFGAGAPGSAPLQSAPPGSAAPQSAPPALPGLSTVVAGVALSLALMLGGLWAFRRWNGAPLPRTVKVGAALSVALAIGAISWSTATADFRPAPRPQGDFEADVKFLPRTEEVHLYLSVSQAEEILRLVRQKAGN
ncbi:hypothetical protein [Lignipirellula cremea]|uniref:Uncharacterized protein n=1 Tax=Lignipirellula cremea TaxID=2528010 RepID=A0A518DPB1_9BACT|nr:hypothetical protein [Lignipirellula cremea]QDU93678.1 hypothetical protein Pla8534_14590 [Lignipirellula cremea]